MEEYLIWVWLGLTVIFVVIEAATSQLVSIWFVAGAVVAMVFALFDLPVWSQVVAFVAVSGAVLALLRPVILKRTRAARVPTNADMVVGQTAVVLTDIDNDISAGRVEVMGADWSARSENGKLIKKGDRVRVLRIEGVRLIVTPI